MAREHYSNSVSSPLNGGINNSTTSIILDDTSSFPIEYPYRIKIDNELMLVTNNNTLFDTLTVERGIEGTAADSHLDNADCTVVLTAQGLRNQLPLFLSVGSPQTLELASGQFTLPADCSYVLLNGESSSADDLEQVDHGSPSTVETGQILVVGWGGNGDVTMLHGNNIRLLNGSAMWLTSSNNYIVMMYDGTNWQELSRSTNNMEA